MQFGPGTRGDAPTLLVRIISTCFLCLLCIPGATVKSTNKSCSVVAIMPIWGNIESAWKIFLALLLKVDHII